VVVRTDVPWRQAWEYATLGLLMAPLLIGTVAWSILLSPRTGIINVAIRTLIPDFTFDVYTLPGMIWVQSLYLTPIVLILISAGLRRMDPELEEAARVFGGSRLRSFFRVTLGAMRPTVLSAAVLCLVIGLESIEIPLIFGFPGRVYVFSGEVYNALRVASPVAYGRAAAVSILLIVAVLGVFAAFLAATRRGFRFITVSGRGRTVAVASLGRWRWLAFGACAVFFALSLVLPFLAIVYASLVKYVGSPTRELLATASLQNYSALGGNEAIVRALRDSLILAVGAGLAVVGLATIIALLAIRFPSPISKVIEGSSLLPLAIPRIGLASAILWAYVGFPLRVYGTLWILALAYMAQFIPVGTRQMSSQLTQISPDLDHASRVAGATPWRTFWRVAVPLLLPGLAGAFFLAFVFFLREFSTSLLLYQAGSEVLAVVLFDLYRQGEMGQVAALSVLFVLAMTALLVLASRLSRGRLTLA
ncbi:MAG: iron ABC transporter permease, partial [Chloroflexi bacterium]|nr:iron ABC transporter permease [Chloroflexota bacterium]